MEEFKMDPDLECGGNKLDSYSKITPETNYIGIVGFIINLKSDNNKK